MISRAAASRRVASVLSDNPTSPNQSCPWVLTASPFLLSPSASISALHPHHIARTALRRPALVRPRRRGAGGRRSSAAASLRPSACTCSRCPPRWIRPRILPFSTTNSDPCHLRRRRAVRWNTALCGSEQRRREGAAKRRRGSIGAAAP